MSTNESKGETPPPQQPQAPAAPSRPEPSVTPPTPTALPGPGEKGQNGADPVPFSTLGGKLSSR
jgi:hypothetical protein